MDPEVKYKKHPTTDSSTSLNAPLFINNEWCDSESGKTFETINPSNGKVICQIAEGDKVDVDRAVVAARAAFKSESAWRKLPPSGRGSLILKLVDLIQRDLDELAALEALDNGKPLLQAKGALMGTMSVLKYYAGWCDKICGKTIPISDDIVCYTRHEPVGVCGQILPWNYPTILMALKIGPVLACGCTTIVKPAEQAPLVILHIASLIAEAGFPAGVVNVIPGYGPTAGAAISSHMNINKVAFTGSLEVGKLIMEAAAKSNLKRVSLELGGKSPLIIFGDVDVKWAAQKAHTAIMEYQGQICFAGSRNFVHESIYDEFVAETVKLAAKSKVGNSLDETKYFGPIVSEEQYQKVLGYIDIGKSEGASLKYGGDRIEGEGYFVQPTVFSDVTDDMTIAKEEIFGPVQSIMKFKTIDEVIERANATTFGLAAGVLTKDLNTAMKVSNALEAGTVWVNCYGMPLAQAPFGGFKQSGIGRELGEEGLKEYYEVKTVTMQLH